jgi:hypothetical protein
MHYPKVFAVLAISALALPARADFVITTAPSGSGQPRARVALSHTVPEKVPIARGFGDRVPLSFAVRQIVPATFKVTYGSGVDPGALVDWRGGPIWSRVLADAIKPLGLRLVLGNMTLEIQK